MPASVPDNNAEQANLGPISASPQYVADALIAFAELTAEDVVFDVGCNDGRIISTAAKVASVKGVGIEISPAAAAKAHQAVLRDHLESHVSIVCGDALQHDLSSATVVFMYLLPRGMSQLLPKLQADLQPGCRVITYMFKIAEWQCYWHKSQSVTSNKSGKMDVGAVSKLHLYKVPDRF